MFFVVKCLRQQFDTIGLSRRGVSRTAKRWCWCLAMLHCCPNGGGSLCGQQHQCRRACKLNHVSLTFCYFLLFSLTFCYFLLLSGNIILCNSFPLLSESFFKNYFSSMLYNFVKVDIAYIILLYTLLPFFKILWNYSMVKLYLCSSSGWHVSPSCFKNVVKLKYRELILF